MTPRPHQGQHIKKLPNWVLVAGFYGIDILEVCEMTSTELFLSSFEHKIDIFQVLLFYTFRLSLMSLLEPNNSFFAKIKCNRNCIGASFISKLI